MATSTSDMPLSGGNPALNFVNTVDSRRGRWGPEFLNAYGDIIVLARRDSLIDEAEAGKLHELAQADGLSAEAALKDAIGLREAIYALFLSEDAKQPYSNPPFEIVHKAARRARAEQVLTRIEDGYQWREPLSEAAHLVGLFAVAATDLLISRETRRPVRECKGDNCGWLFLDTSKSGRRLWCSDATCGTHARVRRFRKQFAEKNTST